MTHFQTITVDQAIDTPQRMATNGASGLQEGTINPSLTYRVGLMLFFGSFGFDFKDRGFIDNPAVLRTIIVVTSLIGFCLAIGTLKRSATFYKLHKSHLNAAFNLWAFFIFYVIFISFVRSQDILSVVIAAAPFVFMFMSMFLMKRHIEAGYMAKSFWTPIIVMSLISLAWTFYFGRYASMSFNEDDFFSFISDIRYSILSSALLPMFAYTIYSISRSKNVAFASIILILITFLFMIAKSRGFLLGIVSVIVFAILANPHRLKTLTLTGIVVGIALAIAVIIPEFTNDLDLIAVWKFRLFGVDDQFYDVTRYTRLAEFYGQMSVLFTDIQSAIFGYGYLKFFYWDARIFDDLVANGFRDDYVNTYSNGGHSAWFASLFHGGLIAGWIPFVSITYLNYLAFFLVIAKPRIRKYISDWGGVAIAIIVSLWFPSNFGSFFGDRVFPMIIGAALIQATHEIHRLKQLKS